MKTKSMRNVLVLAIATGTLGAGCALDPQTGPGEARGEAVYQTGSNIPKSRHVGGEPVQVGNKEEAERVFSFPTPMPLPRPASH